MRECVPVIVCGGRHGRDGVITLRTAIQNREMILKRVWTRACECGCGQRECCGCVDCVVAVAFRRVDLHVFM